MGNQDVASPMTGTLKEILVSVGDRVNQGEEIIIIESMKMEIPVESPAAGTVAEVVVQPPARIDEGDVLMRLEV